MKIFKITQIIIFVLVFQQITFGQSRYYTIEQIKDTLIKYKNPYAGFSKLKLYKIPVNKFRKDSFLIKKANDLLNLNYIKDLCYQRRKNTTLNWYDKYNKKGFIIKYINKTQKISYSKSKLYYDSIASNKVLLDKYFDAALKTEIKKDSIECYSHQSKMTFSYYIEFHSKLMTQTSYDTIRSYYDRYYKKNFNPDKYFSTVYDAVIIGLINMGDPEVREKYDTWFEEKIISGTFSWNNYTFIKNNFFESSYMYKKLSRLLLSDGLIMEILDEEIPLRRHIAIFDFPLIDTITGKPSGDMYCKMIRDFHVMNYNPFSSYEEISKYFMDYAAYLEKKEKVLFENLKYKTNN